jgi:3-(3-hydroxy-phenyl)propionate hydroxylase
MAEIVIIGAGPVGLTLASELKRHGVEARLVDKRPEPQPHPNAAIVHVRTLEILAAMGAVDGFLREGYSFPGLHVRAFGQQIGFIDVRGIDSPYPGPVTLPQNITERLLTENLRRLGGSIERGVEAVGIELSAGEVRLRLKHADGRPEETATAKWVVGCEGSASLTREALKIDFPGERYPGKEFLQADTKVRWSFPHGYGYQFVAPEYVLLFFPYDAVGHYRIICARDDRDPANKNPPTLEEMQGIVQAVADPAAELYEPVWLNRFRSGHRLAGKFREGRAFLAGDAGHVHIPIGGQGMNYGMHDAFNLGWKLAAVAKGEARAALLETYETERHATDEKLIRATDLAFHLMMRPRGAIAETAIKSIGPLLLGTDLLQGPLRQLLAEVTVAYPESSLSEDHEGSHGPRAGDRAPDALIVQMSDRSTKRLFELFSVPRWTLLLFAGHKPTPDEIEGLERGCSPLSRRYGARLVVHLILCSDPPVPVHANWAADVLMDRQRYAHDKYGVAGTPCLYLIRPDGYIGFRGGADCQASLISYLDRFLI